MSDLYAVDNGKIQSVFTPAELSDFRRRLREDLLPKLSHIRYDWQSNRDSDQQPDSHIQPLIESFEALQKEFAGEPAILADIGRQIEYAREWIVETEAEDGKPTKRPARVFGDVDPQDQPRAQVRTIFDDIDE